MPRGIYQRRPRTPRASIADAPRASIADAPQWTLGWELEATRRASAVPMDVAVDRDGSVGGEGLEYKINENVVGNRVLVLNALKLLATDAALSVDRSCGFHVHISMSGVNVVQKKVWASWMVQLARAIEADAWQAVPESRRLNNYCRPWSALNGAVQTMTYHPVKYQNAALRYQWVNVVEMFRPGGIGTVEIRLLGNTRRFTYLLGWISACQIMANSAWKLVADPSASVLEIQTVKSAFQSVARDIRPNTDVAVSVAASNTLAMQAGFDVRAGGATGENQGRIRSREIQIRGMGSAWASRALANYAISVRWANASHFPRFLELVTGSWTVASDGTRTAFYNPRMEAFVTANVVQEVVEGTALTSERVEWSEAVRNALNIPVAVPPTVAVTENTRGLSCVV